MGGCYSASGYGATISPKHKLPKERSKQNGKPDVYVYGSNIEGLEDSRCVGKVKEEEDDRSSVGRLNDERKIDTKNSDSGIGSLGSSTEKEVPPFEEKLDDGCDRCQQKILRNSRTACEVCGEITFKKSAFPTYCSCGPRHATWASTKHNICATHANSPKIYRNSDIVGLKSSLKKLPNRPSQRHNHLSWKSSDTLDYVNSMCTSMDRAKSEASDIFRDDISFRAPLAAFDSVEDHLESSTTYIYQPRACRTSILSNIDLESSSTEIYRSHSTRTSIVSETNPESRTTDTYQSPACRTSIQSEIENLANSICRCEFSASDFVKGLENGPVIKKESRSGEDGNDNCKTNNVVPSDIVVNGNKGDRDNFIHHTYRSRRSADVSEDRVFGDRQSDIVCNGVDNAHVDLRKKQGKVPSVRPSYSESDDGLLFMSLPSRDQMQTMVVDGREMVLVDVDVYDQVMNGLAQLRSSLSQLSTVIQESEDIDSSLNWAESYIQHSYVEEDQ